VLVALVDEEGAFVPDIKRARLGPIPPNAADCDLPVGMSPGRSGNRSAGRASGDGARDTYPDARFYGTVELAHADAFGVEASADGAGTFGPDLPWVFLRQLEPWNTSSAL
jgi:hypothetical protein